jgi:hypothetical protein
LLKVLKKFEDLRIADPVNDSHSSALTDDEACLSQDGQMLGQVRLPAVQSSGKVHHVGSPVSQKIDDLQANRMTQGLGRPRDRSGA